MSLCFHPDKAQCFWEQKHKNSKTNIWTCVSTQIKHSGLAQKLKKKLEKQKKNSKTNIWTCVSTQIKHSGTVSACGLAAGMPLPTTVILFFVLFLSFSNHQHVGCFNRVLHMVSWKPFLFYCETFISWIWGQILNSHITFIKSHIYIYKELHIGQEYQIKNMKSRISNQELFVKS